MSTVTLCALKNGHILGGKFIIGQCLGIGGMGAVYLAEDIATKQTVAVKILHAEYYGNKEYIKRFLREIELLKSISHENVIKILGAYAEEGLVYFSMEYISGKSLETLIRENTLSVEDSIKIFNKICLGVERIHALDIIHRDLKPANILVDSFYNPKIIDFGIARSLHAKITNKGIKVGSAYYISPEVWIGKEPTIKSDIYCLGILLYEMLTGTLPISGNSVSEIMKAHLQSIPREPHSLNINVPKWLSELCVRMLEKEPKDRPKEVFEITNEVVLMSGTIPAETIIKPQMSRVKCQDEQIPQKIPLRQSGMREKVAINKLEATVIVDKIRNEKTDYSGLHKSVVIPVTSARKFSIRPSRDVIFFGIFLISLHIADGYLTSKGITRYGAQSEGNPIYLWFFQYFSPYLVLGVGKIFACVLVLAISIYAQHTRYVRTIINTLSCIYLVFAIIPWLYILFVA